MSEAHFKLTSRNLMGGCGFVYLKDGTIVGCIENNNGFLQPMTFEYPDKCDSHYNQEKGTYETSENSTCNLCRAIRRKGFIKLKKFDGEEHTDEAVELIIQTYKLNKGGGE